MSTLILSNCSKFTPEYALKTVSFDKDKGVDLTTKSTKTSKNSLRYTYFGNTTILIQDGDSAIMIDGFVSRPSVTRVFLTPIKSDTIKVAQFLKDGGITKLDAVFVAHSHYDHLLDAPLVARMTGAKLVGSDSTLNVGREMLPENRLVRLDKEAPQSQCPLKYGKFTVTTLPGDHAKAPWLIDQATKGDIPRGFRSPAHAMCYKEGGSFTFHIQHPQGTCIVHASANARNNHIPEGMKADVVFLGIGLFEKMEPTRDKQRAYWQEMVNCSARSEQQQIVVPIHWDNLFRSLDKPLKPMKSAKHFHTFLKSSQDLILPNTKIIWMDKFSSLSMKQ